MDLTEFTDEVPLPDQPQPSSAPAGPNLSSDATYHPGYHPTVMPPVSSYAPLRDFQYKYGYSNSVGEGPTSSTQYYQQNAQGGHNTFSAPQPPSFTYWSVYFFLFRVFFFVSD